MRVSRLFSITLVIGSSAAAAIVACGGNDTTHPDAKVFKDAMPMPDSTPGVMGLGQTCGSGLPSCPTNASACATVGGGKGFCTAVCDMNATGTTNASSQFPQSGSGSIMPAPDNTPCTSAFMGSAGMAGCFLIGAHTPTGNLMPNTAYTGIQMACGIVCGAGNTCPGGMTCTQMLCLPM